MSPDRPRFRLCKADFSFVVLMLLMSPFIKKFGNVAARQFGFLCYAIGSIGMLFTTNWAVVIFFYAFIGLGWAFQLGSQGALLADTAQHAGDKAGFDVSGVSNAGQTFVGKFGGGLASGLLGWLLGLFGYDGTAAVQTERAVLGVKVSVLILPSIIMIVSALILTQYDLYKKGYIKEGGRG